MSSTGYPPVDQMDSFIRFVLHEPPHESTDLHAIPTGFGELDELVGGGLRAGQLTLAAGTTGVGTSIFALCLARSAAFRHDVRTALIAPDSSHAEVLTRIVSAEALVAVSRIRAGKLTEDERQRLRDARDRIAAGPLWINAEFGVPMTTEVVLDTVDYMTDGDGAQLVIVDGTSQLEPRTRDFARGLRSIGQARGLAIVVVSKVVMPASRRAEPPTLEDLQEHPEMTDMFDLVLTIHRPDAQDPKSTRPGEADVHIAKHRYGPTHHVTLAFQGHFARFVDIARE